MDEIDYNKKMRLSEVIDQEYVEWASAATILNFCNHIIKPKLELNYGYGVLSPNICYLGQGMDIFSVLKILKTQNYDSKLREDGCYDIYPTKYFR